MELVLHNQGVEHGILVTGRNRSNPRSEGSCRPAPMIYFRIARRAHRARVLYDFSAREARLIWNISTRGALS